jgi:hypothetical protein
MRQSRTKAKLSEGVPALTLSGIKVVVPEKPKEFSWQKITAFIRALILLAVAGVLLVLWLEADLYSAQPTYRYYWPFPSPYYSVPGPGQNQVLPESQCFTCPYCSNRGRPLREYFDYYLSQYVWEYSCYKNHIWRCFANPTK